MNIYKKIIFLSVILGLNVFSTIFSQTPVNFYTPRGTLIPDTYIIPEDLESTRLAFDNDYGRRYPNAVQIQRSSATYNCHGYAWSVSLGGPYVWIGAYNEGQVYLFFEEPTGDGSYDFVAENVATHVKYSRDHSARTTSTPNYYISKWNRYPLMYHHKDYHPGYGTPNQFLVRSIDVPIDRPNINNAISAAVNGRVIKVANGTYTENITIPYGVGITGSGINNTTLNGTVTINNSYGSSLQDIKVNNAISVNNSNEVRFTNVKAGTSNCYVDAVGSSVTLDNFYSDVSQTRALYIHNGSSYFSTTGTYRNKYDGIHVQDNSTGQSNWDMFCQNITYDIVTFNNSSVTANGCYFSKRQEGSSVYGDVTWMGWSTCSSGLTKTMNEIFYPEYVKENNPQINSEFSQLAEKYYQIKMKKSGKDRSGLTSITSSGLEESLRMFIEKYPESIKTPSVVGLLGNAMQEEGKYQELDSYLNTLSGRKEMVSLRPFIMNSMVSNKIKTKQYKESIELSDRLLKEYPEHLLAVEWNYGKAIVYKYHLNEEKKAEEILRGIINKYPSHPTAESAKKELGILNEKEISLKKEIAEAGYKFETTSAPNPFNPSTRISYVVEKAGMVNLKIYNSIGQEVVELVNEEKQPGKYEVEFNAGKLASGMYIYRIVVPGYNVSKKIMLLK